MFDFPAAPVAPTNLSAIAGTGQVILHWTASSGAASYDVYRVTDSGSENPTPIATGVTGTRFTDTGLANGTTYFYEVAAVNSLGTSSPSPEVSATLITLSPATLPGGTIGGSYSQLLTASESGFTYQVTAGSLPPGLTLNAGTGLLSGMPHSFTGSPFSFTVQATNSRGDTGSQTYSFPSPPLGHQPQRHLRGEPLRPVAPPRRRPRRLLLGRPAQPGRRPRHRDRSPRNKLRVSQQCRDRDLRSIT